MRIGVLGGGTMGELIVRALLEREIVTPQSVLIAEADPRRRADLASLEVGVTEHSTDLAPFAEVVLLCVKPQDARAALQPLQGKLGADTLAISIMAGIDLGFLQHHLAHAVVVRSMPNLPARIGAGMTVWQAAPEVPGLQRVVVKTIFQCLGRELEVTREDLLDAATAVSGTGPAYIFYIAENLLEAALELGFDDAQALKLVRQTFRGAMDLWAASGESPAVLRRKVTSKGGTTEAAVAHFVAHDIAGTFRAGVGRACQRARELSELSKRG